MQERVRTPLDAPKIVSNISSELTADPARYWGSYRSHTYFGMKTRSARSPVLGLMWFTEFIKQWPLAVRHWCDQGDGLSRYGWQKHDGVNFGVQDLEEKTFTLKTEYVKRPGGQHGGDWSARISVKPKVSVQFTAEKG